MKLIIDIGNTSSKIAIFNYNEIIDFQIIEKLNKETLNSILEKHPKIKSSILSSVSKHDDEIISILKKNLFFIELTHSTPVPFNNNYATPASLGKDRIAIASAATSLYPKKNVLVIDAGTCITYDIITNNGDYLGGAISPGLRMRFKALHNFTHSLPLVNLPVNAKEVDLVGNTTSTSILSGVINGINAEMESTINQYKMRYNPLLTVISGGDYYYFEKLLKSNIFATPNIVVHGLKKILDFNEKD